MRISTEILNPCLRSQFWHSSGLRERDSRLRSSAAQMLSSSGAKPAGGSRLRSRPQEQGKGIVSGALRSPDPLVTPPGSGTIPCKSPRPNLRTLRRARLGQSCVIQYRDRETAKGGLERGRPSRVQRIQKRATFKRRASRIPLCCPKVAANVHGRNYLERVIFVCPRRPSSTFPTVSQVVFMRDRVLRHLQPQDGEASTVVRLEG